MNTLQSVLLYDLKRRQTILREELTHLTQSIRYRLTKFDGTAKRHLTLMGRAVDELIKEVDADVSERVAFLDWRKNAQFIRERDDGRDDGLPGVGEFTYQEYLCFHIVWQAKMMRKAAVIAERISDLHDRLEQQLERTLPDYPNPVLRRRTELGQADKFLCEHVKWVHRDLARATKLLGASYPYSEIPPIFYSWQYVSSSSQHEFISYENSKLERAQRAATMNGGFGPAKFTSLGVSYWMVERAVSHPLIGHEIAHQVIQDIYGRGAPYDRLGVESNQLDLLIGRIRKCAESWLLHRRDNPKSKQMTWELVREILCDVLAAQRYGVAYLHAWIIEISEQHELADLFHDHGGMLRRMDFKGVNSNYLHREIFRPSMALATNMRFDVYYRGVVLVHFLKSLGREADKLKDELLSEVNQWLDSYLQLITGAIGAGDEDRNRADEFLYFEREFARDLADTVVEEYPRERIEPDGLGRAKQSKVVRAANMYWITDSAGAPTDFCLRQQCMSNPVRKRYFAMITALRGDQAYKDGLDPTKLRTFQDGMWRLEWAWASRRKEYEGELPGALELRNQMRALNSIAVDDYLYRTGNPLALKIIFHDQPQFCEGADKIGVQIDNVDDSIDGSKLSKVHCDPWVTSFDEKLRDKYTSMPMNGEGAIYKKGALSFINFCAPIRLNETDWDELGLNTDAFRLYALYLESQSPARRETTETSHPNGVAMAQLLGRYDRITISDYTGNENSAVARDDGNAVRVARLKKILYLGAGKLNLQGLDIVATVLLSLKWEATRLMFAIWLKRSIDCGYVKLFLSDGWEDLVLVCTKGKCEEYDDAIDRVFDIVKCLNDSPFVGKTETLFSESVLASGKRLRYRFVCTRNSVGLGHSLDGLRTVLKGMPSLQSDDYVIDNISGAKDIQITMKDTTTNYVEIHKLLHGVASGIGLRVETRVSWLFESSEPPAIQEIHTVGTSQQAVAHIRANHY